MSLTFGLSSQVELQLRRFHYLWFTTCLGNHYCVISLLPKKTFCYPVKNVIYVVLSTLLSKKNSCLGMCTLNLWIGRLPCVMCFIMANLSLLPMELRLGNMDDCWKSNHIDSYFIMSGCVLNRLLLLGRMALTGLTWGFLFGPTFHSILAVIPFCTRKWPREIMPERVYSLYLFT